MKNVNSFHQNWDFFRKNDSAERVIRLLSFFFLSSLQPIEEVYIEDESTTETTRAISDDVFAEEFDSYFTQQGAAEEDGKHSGARYSSTSAKRNGSDDQKLPKCERKQFSQLVYASLNQLTDRNALQAMMEIQGVLTKYRLASLPN